MGGTHLDRRLGGYAHRVATGPLLVQLRHVEPKVGAYFPYEHRHGGAVAPCRLEIRVVVVICSLAESLACFDDTAQLSIEPVDPRRR